MKEEQINVTINVKISFLSILKLRLLGLHKPVRLSRAEKIDVFLKQVGGEEE